MAPTSNRSDFGRAVIDLLRKAIPEDADPDMLRHARIGVFR